MKTGLKIAGGILVAIVVAVLVFYIGWLRPPAPETVCENVEKVTVAELKTKGVDATDAMKTELRTSCVKWASKRPEFGLIPWVKKLECARDGETLAELEACGVK